MKGTSITSLVFKFCFNLPSAICKRKKLQRYPPTFRLGDCFLFDEIQFKLSRLQLSFFFNHCADLVPQRAVVPQKLFFRQLEVLSTSFFSFPMQQSTKTSSISAYLNKQLVHFLFVIRFDCHFQKKLAKLMNSVYFPVISFSFTHCGFKTRIEAIEAKQSKCIQNHVSFDCQNKQYCREFHLKSHCAYVLAVLL